MMEGKIPENVLKRSVLKELKIKNENVITGAAFGEDCAILNIDQGLPKDSEKTVKTGVTTVYGEGKEGAIRALIKASNNLNADGFDIKYVQICVIMGEDFEESDLKDLMRKLNKCCEQLDACITGGDYTVIKNAKDNFEDVSVCITAIGTPFDDRSFSKKSIGVGDYIVVSKWIGIEGAIEITDKKKDEIIKHFGKAFSDYFERYEEMLSIKRESKTAANTGAIAMKAVSERGIFGALWEIASVADLGLKVDIKAIPVRQEIIEICNYYDINPYEMRSAGMLIMVTKNPKELITELSKEGIKASMIGTFTDNRDRIVINGEDVRFLEKIKQDAICGLK